MIQSIMVLILLVLMQQTVQAKIYAVYSTSRYSADIKYIPVDYASEKWYIGECSGDITMSADRLHLYESDRKGTGVQEVGIVYNKFEATTVICIK